MEELGKVTDYLSLELASYHTLNSLTDLTDNAGELSGISCSGVPDVLNRDILSTRSMSMSFSQVL